jgi:hypothetical protein
MYVLKINPVTSDKWDGSKVDEETDRSGRTDSEPSRRQKSTHEAYA